MPTLLAPSGVDHDLVRRLKAVEDARFAAEHPMSAALLARGRAVMPQRRADGLAASAATTTCRCGLRRVTARTSPTWTATRYRDFNIADMSMFCGYAPEPLVRAVSRQMARGNQFLLPTEDAIVVSEELGRRFGLPKWQYTSSATHANTEAIRVARVVTGRDTVLMFDGKYHGHFDEALVEIDDDGRLVPEERGLPADTVAGTVLVPFNDVAALRRALERHDIAVVLTEPAITNNIGLLLPDGGLPRRASAASPGRRARSSRMTRRTRRSWGPAGSPHSGGWSRT